MANPVYKVDHRYNPSPAWVSEFSKARLEQSSSSSSFRAEIEQKLMHWRTLQNKKQCMEQQQRRTIQTEVKQHLETPTDDFERIMNEDLNQQLEALELEEQEQYQQLKTSIADDLKQRSIFEEHIQERIQIMKELDRLEEEEKKQREKLQVNRFLAIILYVTRIEFYVFRRLSRMSLWIHR